MAVSGSKYSLTVRIAWMFVLSAAVLLLFPSLANIGDDLGFWVVFVYLLIFSILQGIVTTSVYQVCSEMPGKYMGATMFGQGLSGIASNVLRAISLAFWPIS